MTEVAVNRAETAQTSGPGGPAVLVSALALNVAYNAAHLIDGHPWWVLLTPAVDVLAVLALVLLLARVMKYHWVPYFGVSVALLGLTILRTGAAFVAAVYDRRLTLGIDLGYLDDLLNLSRGAIGHPATVALLAGAVAVIVAALLGTLALLRGLHRAAGTSSGWLTLAAVTAAATIGAVGVGASTPTGLYEVAYQVGVAANAKVVQGERESEVTRQAEAIQEAPQPLDLLTENVLLFIIESYGYTVLDNPKHFAMISADYQRHSEALQEAGFQVVSNLLESPAFGGNSWLAKATLATGLRVADQDYYELLLSSEVKSLARFFNDASYRTVNAMPATGPNWPAGDFYGYQHKYYYREFNYQGPPLRWAPMTDQYAVDYIHRHEVAVAQEPLFIQYVLISSHYPFNAIPRYFPDWSQVGDGSVYHDTESVYRLPPNSVNETGLSEGYILAIQYSLQVVLDYLVQFISDDTLVIVVGDHQPWSGISGRGAPRSSLIHVLSRKPERIERFRARGYTDGLIPRQSPPHDGMETFFGRFIEDFSSGPVVPTAPPAVSVPAE